MHFISIHAPPRGATIAPYVNSAIGGFQFTPLREGRRLLGGTHRNRTDFNSRPSARGDSMKSPCSRPLEFQFTPLREGRPVVAVAVLVPRHFNSRPSARGDQLIGGEVFHVSHFNSRPSARGDCEASIRKFKRNIISIHAPPRGATFRAANPAPGATFQFTPLREGRPSDLAIATGQKVFQFTPLREGRPAKRFCFMAQIPPYFNSRPSARGDGKRYAISANLLFNPYKSAWLNNSATQFVEIILVIFHRIIA